MLRWGGVGIEIINIGSPSTILVVLLIQVVPLQNSACTAVRPHYSSDVAGRYRHYFEVEWL